MILKICVKIVPTVSENDVCIEVALSCRSWTPDRTDYEFFPKSMMLDIVKVSFLGFLSCYFTRASLSGQLPRLRFIRQSFTKADYRFTRVCNLY